MWLGVKKYWPKAILALVLLGITFGIHATYSRYRGTGLSRLPVGSGPLEAAEGVGDNATHVSGKSVSYRRTTPPAPYVEDDLRLYPTVEKGMRTPFDLWRYYGRGVSSFSSPVLPMRFEQWLEFHRKQKPGLMADVHDYMNDRFDFSEAAIPEKFMTGGKPIMQGPVARLTSVESFEELAALKPNQIRQRDLFPYKPLAHPLQSTAHMVFPRTWIEAHPEHSRIDVDMDIPEAYLPEFPPPLFLTTHKELGDVAAGREITLDNYYEIFDGLLSPEQMEGLKELLRPPLRPHGSITPIIVLPRSPQKGSRALIVT